MEAKKSLGLWDSTMIVSGSMIGSGIFIVSSDMARQLYSPYWLLGIWVLTGLLTLSAALSYGELSGLFPKAGGQYVYLREAYGKVVGFLYGWSMFSVIQTGTIAAVGVAFSKFTGYFLPVFNMDSANVITEIPLGFYDFKLYPAQLLAIGTIVFLSWYNTRGVEGGKWLQNIFTGTKLLALFGLIVAGFVVGFNPEVWAANWAIGSTAQAVDASGGDLLIPLTLSATVGAVAASMVGSVFSSDAWNNITFIAGEVRQPEKNIGRALMLGTLMVSGIYVLTNVMYLGVLPMDSIAHAPQDRVGVAAAEAILGNSGTYLLAALIMISTFGCNNGLIFSGARVYYTMANDGLFFKKAATLNASGVPARAIWLQAIWASLLCLSGKYGDLLDYVVFCVMIFYILTIAGVIILRYKRPELVRTYKAPLYPVLPILYILLAMAFCVALLVYKPNYTWPGLIIVLMGLPIYALTLREKGSR
ncbi:MAG: APC family permease [Flavobacteriales bacterium]